MLNLERQIADNLKQPIEHLGYIFWGVELRNDKYSKIVCIYIDKEEGITVDDCSEVILFIKSIISVDDSIIPDDYMIEVSSPGMDRVLFNIEQYNLYLNEKLSIVLKTPVNGKRKFKAKLLATQDNSIVVEFNNNQEIIEINNIKRANIEPTF
ncbi:MAG: hypothetical protein R3Y52_00695 [Psittacicella sp.]